MNISIRAARTNANLTQAQAAKAIGVDRGTIIRWEQGGIIPGDKLVALCGLYKIAAEDVRFEEKGASAATDTPC